MIKYDELNKAVLGKFYRFDEIDLSRFLLFDFVQFPVPTQTTVYKAQFIVPVFGRAYITEHYEYKGKILCYADLVKTVQDKGETFTGTGDYNTVYLCEVWSDCGADGQIEEKHVGYRFCTSKEIEKCEHKMPKCSHYRYEDFESC